MGQILRSWRILIAAAVSVLIMVGAYLLASGALTPTAQASEESELLQAIASRDQDNDGLPDWEESLYGTDPFAIDSHNLGMSDGEAVKRGLLVPKAIADLKAPPSSSEQISVDGISAPADGTLTATFAQNLLSLYLSAKQENGGDLSEDQLQELATKALAAISSSVVRAPDFKAAGDLEIVGSGSLAMKDFAGRAEAVLRANKTTATKTELEYLRSTAQENDADAIAQLISIAKTYRASAIGLAALPVPSELAAADLELINAMMRLSEVIADFSRVSSDPLATMLALQLYPQAALNFGTAWLHITEAYTNAGVALSLDDPGVVFVNMSLLIPKGAPAP